MSTGPNTLLGIPSNKAADPSTGEVFIYLANGAGSVGTSIPRFSTVGINTGTAITYIDSALNGSSFLINTSGVYYVELSWDPAGGGAPAIGITKNNAYQNASAVSSIDLPTVLVTVIRNNATSGVQLICNTTTRLTYGDVVRPQVDAASNGAGNTTCHFRIVKVGA